MVLVEAEMVSCCFIVCQFILVFVLMLIFEIFDLQFDDLKLKTIPQQLGIKKAKWLNYLLIFIFLFLEYFKPNITLNQFAVTFLVATILGLFTYYAKSKRSKYYTSFWVESVPMIWLVLLLILGQLL